MKNDKTMVASRMNKRNVNIDVLRVVLMLLIVFWHFLIHGLKISFPDTPCLSLTTGTSVLRECFQSLLLLLTATF